MPATLAILSIVFVESIYTAAGTTDEASAPTHKALSVLVLVLVTLANCVSTKASTRLNNFFVGTKFVAILAVAAAGLSVVVIHLVDPEHEVGGVDWAEKPWFQYRKTVDSDGNETDWASLGSWEILGYLSTALYAALWAYSGWDKERERSSGSFATLGPVLMAPYRRLFTSRPSYLTPSGNSHCPSTLPSRQSSSVS